MSWFHRLYEKPEFHECVRELYRTVFILHVNNLINEDIQTAADHVSQSARVNNIRWNLPDAGAEADKLCDFLQQRVEFLNKYWQEEEEYHLVHVAKGQSVWGCVAVRDGDCIPDILDTAEGWYGKNLKKIEIIYIF